MPVAIVTVENVLAQGDDLKVGAATKWGKALYDGMRSQFNVILLTQADPDIAKWWMQREAMLNYSSMLYWPHNGLFDYPMWRVDQIRSFLADGWDIAFHLDNDPKVLFQVGQLGVVTLSVSYPTHHVGWRDRASTAPRSWSVVVDTVDRTGGM